MESLKVDAAIAELGGAQHGVLLAEQVFELGITREALRHRVRRGWIVRVHRGLYRLRDHPWTWHAEAQAALLLAGWGAVVSHGSAARLHGMWAYRSHGTVDVSLPEGSNQRQRHGRLHITSWMPEDHVTALDGLPVTTVARTCFDLAGDVEPRWRTPGGRLVHEQQIRRVFNDALRNRGLALIHEAAVLVALAGRGRSGTVLVRQLLDEFGPAYEPTDSDGEDLFLDIVRAFGLPTPRTHVVLSDREGFIGEVDFVFDPWVIVEVDGVTHRGPLDIAHDRQRDDRLRRLGFVVERVTYRPELVLHPERVARRVLDLLESMNRPHLGGSQPP